MSDPPAPAAHRLLAALLVVYCAKALVLALVCPPFTGHDEVAHYEYIRVLSTDGRPPSLLTDRLPEDLFPYHAYALQWDATNRFTAPLYTALHPPLYYILMVPIYRATRGAAPEVRQLAVRLASIPFGLVTVLLAFAVARVLFPRDGFIPAGAAALVAFQPQVAYEAAMVNNDMCAIAVFSGLIYLLVLTLRDGASTGRAAGIGALLGLGLLAKSSTLAGLPLAVIVLLYASRGGLAVRARQLGIALLVLLALVAPWYAFLYRTYGNFSGLPQLAAIQTELTRQDATTVQLLLSGAFAADRWSEAWGGFGWKLIPLDGWLLTALALFAALALVGLAAGAFVAWRCGDEAPGALPISGWRGAAILLLCGTCFVSYAAVAQFGTRFVLTQARYFFPSIIPAAILALAGLRAWLPAGRLVAARALAIWGLVALNVITFTAFLIPYWHFRG